MGGVRQGEKTGRAQDHGHDAQTAGRKIQRMIAAMTVLGDRERRERRDEGERGAPVFYDDAVTPAEA